MTKEVRRLTKAGVVETARVVGRTKFLRAADDAAVRALARALKAAPATEGGDGMAKKKDKKKDKKKKK